MEKGKIVLLNGTSSAGKTTLAKALQDNLDEPYYHICSDDFMHMTPRQLLHGDFDRQMAITQGMMRETAALFSDRGHSVVVDDVIVDAPEGSWLSDYYQRFEGYPVLFVLVECPLEELERREKARGDRQIGQARWNLEHLNRRIPYDLTVNTYDMSVQKCVDTIKERLCQPDRWTAFAEGRAGTEKQ